MKIILNCNRGLCSLECAPDKLGGLLHGAAVGRIIYLGFTDIHNTSSELDVFSSLE